MDSVTKGRRSEIMSRIHGGLRDNGMERKVHNLLKGNKIRHRMYPKVVGNPDVHLVDCDTYIFLDGCFWHCCPLHYRRPKSNLEFWIPHVEKSNRKRERLRKGLPYKWVRIWEHDVRNGDFRKILLGETRNNDKGEGGAGVKSLKIK